MVIEFFSFPFDPSSSFFPASFSEPTFPPVVSVLQYMWLLDVREDKGGFEGYVGGVEGTTRQMEDRSAPQVGVLGRRCFFCRWRVEVELSFCCRLRRFAHVEGCSNSSDRLAPVTRSSAF